MNNKGFTLVEVLAVIVIIGVVMGIATTSVISAINASKAKSEKVFVDKWDSAVETYIDYKRSSFSEIGVSYSFQKCKKVNDDGSCRESNPRVVNVEELSSFNMKTMVSDSSSTIKEKDLKNPANNQLCLNSGKNPTVRVFKDDDYVYYYYMDLSGNNTACDIKDENAIITNIPKKLCSAIKQNEPSIKCEDKYEK